MKKLSQLSKMKIIGIFIIIISLAIGIIIYTNREKELTIQLKDNKTITIEYGKTMDVNFDNFILKKAYSQEEYKKLKKETKITTNLINEEGKDYPAIGKYVIKMQYKDQTVNKKVIVKDTTKPVFNDTNEVSYTINTKNYDYASVIQATDLSSVEVTFDTTQINIAKAGDYKLLATAKDT